MILLGVAVLLATAPSSVPQSAATKLLGPLGDRSIPQEEARVRLGDLGPAPSTVAASSAPAPAGSTVTETVIAPPPAEFDAPAARAAPPPSALHAAAAPAGGVWAVVIGIDDYPGHRSDLRSAVADANDLDAALAAYGVTADRRLVLRNTQASAAVIAESMRWLVAHARSDATAVFFYAGHVRKIGRGREAIVAADGGLVSDLRMAELLAPLAARQTWIGMASCYGGGFNEVLGRGRILTGAAGADSLAYESATYGNSYMVEYMVERAMLHGHAAGSIEQSFAWAANALATEHPERVPVQYDYVAGELRLGTPHAPRPQPAPPPPQSGGEQPTPPPPEDEPDDDGNCLLSLGALAGCDDRTRRD